MFSSFLRDTRGNYTLITAVVAVPLMGALALGIDYTEMSRQRQVTLNALDAAGLATARRAVEGASEAELVEHAHLYFRTNLGSLDPDKATLNVVLPSNDAGGGTLRLSADLKYDPYFLGAFVSLLDGGGEIEISLNAMNEIRLKNTLEVALVLDNSGSMDNNGSGTGRKRMTLLKEAAKELVDTIARQAAQMKQVDKPVQFSLVPFAASVNVGAQHANATWMDVDGRSPIHHENFDWSTMPASHRVQFQAGVWRKTGPDWGAQQGTTATRFSLYQSLRRVTATQRVKVGTERRCTRTDSRGRCTASRDEDVFDNVPTAYGPYASWAGCVETRPHPYAYDVTPPSAGNPATLFVPMFAPDETDRRDGSNRRAMGHWWPDYVETNNDANRQKDMRKYFFKHAAMGTAQAGFYEGPNAMCSTTPITPLTDVSTAAGVKTIKDALDAMQPLGATDVPEGIAWGWRTLTSGQPFAHGRPGHEKGNDKVLIVLTDGENTYYTPSSLGYNDLAGNRSIYSNKGYTGKPYNGSGSTRLFRGSSVNANTHTNANFTRAMNEHMDTVCESAKAAGVIVMTVALDLSTSVAVERDAIEGLRNCASDSRFRRDPDNPSRPAKLFWNANGSNLADKFREIADELSNLRIIG